MAFVVKPGKNAIVRAAFAALDAQQRAQKKKPPEATPAPSKSKPQRAARKGKQCK